MDEVRDFGMNSVPTDLALMVHELKQRFLTAEPVVLERTDFDNWLQAGKAGSRA
jgi:hypothetical protein